MTYEEIGRLTFPQYLNTVTGGKPQPPGKFETFEEYGEWLRLQ